MSKLNNQTKVFCDIMVLASRPPIDPDNVNTNSKNIWRISFKFYMWVDNPLGYFTNLSLSED